MASEKQRMEKKRKLCDDDKEYSPQGDMCPDRTLSDFYCKICDAHMNSPQMWESHVSGKRHLKNAKKEPGELPSKVKAIRVNATPKLMEAIQHVEEPLVGLGFMTELQRSDPSLNPSYTCHLCQSNLTWSVVIDHILGTKHRMAYLKATVPLEHEVIENMELKKHSLDRLAEDRARDFERQRGCGTMEVKLEKPKGAPPIKREKIDDEGHSVSRHSRSLSPDGRMDEYDQRSRSPPPYRRKRPASHVDEKWSHDRFSPGPPSPPPRYQYSGRRSFRLSDILSQPLYKKLNILRRICEKLVLVSETEVKEATSVASILSRNVLQLLIRRLPIEKQNKLAKHIVKNDTKNIERDLRSSLELVFDAAIIVLDNRHHRRLSSSSKHSKRH